MTSHQQEIQNFGKHDDFWLFGYGSLIWKPPPHWEKRVPGYIEGYVRRFWQASEDHRGTPDAPGRVVTLIERDFWETLGDKQEAPTRVWGAAYYIPSQHVAEVREYLDIREINGYSIQFTPFHAAPDSSMPQAPSSSPSTSVPDRKPWKCLVYIGLPDNPQFLGAQDMDELARHILKSKGPSGENREYLFNLEMALLGLSKESQDEHISGLVQRCRQVEKENSKITNGAGIGKAQLNHASKEHHVDRKERGPEEVEEIEKNS